MPKLVDLTGSRFGRLIVVKRVGTRLGHPEWLCKCGCGNEHVATTNALRQLRSQSCGCLRDEFLRIGPNPHRAVERPVAVKISFPIPENLHHNPMVNAVMRRIYQYRWERVEREAAAIEKGTWKEPTPKKYVTLPIDLKTPRKIPDLPIPFVPSSINIEVASLRNPLLDRVRVVSAEEFARLLQ